MAHRARRFGAFRPLSAPLHDVSAPFTARRDCNTVRHGETARIGTRTERGLQRLVRFGVSVSRGQSRIQPLKRAVNQRNVFHGLTAADIPARLIAGELVAVVYGVVIVFVFARGAAARRRIRVTTREVHSATAATRRFGLQRVAAAHTMQSDTYRNTTALQAGANGKRTFEQLVDS